MIQKPDEGWVEWKTHGGTAREFRLVHHKLASPLKGEDGCYARDHEMDSSMHLDWLTGPDGVARLLSISVIDPSCWTRSS